MWSEPETFGKTELIAGSYSPFVHAVAIRAIIDFIFYVVPCNFFASSKSEVVACLNTKAKCPIVPIALIDSYKSFDTKSIEKIKVQVHILKPMLYEDKGIRNKIEKQPGDMVFVTIKAVKQAVCI